MLIYLRNTALINACSSSILRVTDVQGFDTTELDKAHGHKHVVLSIYKKDSDWLDKVDDQSVAQAPW